MPKKLFVLVLAAIFSSFVLSGCDDTWLDENYDEEDDDWYVID